MKHTFTLSILISACLLATPASAGWLDNLAGTQAKTEKATTATVTQSNELVGSVMSQLGLSQAQAEGGLGSLLGLAQSSLGTNDYTKLAASIPNADSLLAAVPKLDGNSGVSGLLSKAGNIGSSLQGSAMVLDAFEKLGISKELAMPMINIAKSYLETNGAEGSSDLLMKGLNALL
ncbi:MULTISPECIES: DUF2780 domain-containing protein [Shewanella]|uniref:DUF2780 domain-containing protein n=2 Tax=Shewanella decolorationis TaxID=256839 RepID=A0A5B8R2S3_9GAMM|nr:DUF2780 domain-containing protein [Shewanella decolorationis]ESE43219.1 hypothetical protein SHD_0113 [Shewanella decolorationis S12]QDZ92697.1 DUF2780 domain-containing protein [Shewanella decolorationis]GLR30946.1 hypothetical protein GCM10007922_05030 [Shewanella decolorationis]